ncbi:MAG: KUP/HAK/KT family potassium transporter [Bacteroidota bacterium]
MLLPAFGTNVVGAIFGPIMTTWFIFIGIFGAIQLGS